MARIPKGFFPQQDTGAVAGRHAGAAGHLVLRHGKGRAAGGRHHQGGPRRGERDGIHRRPGRHQYRVRLHRAEAARTSARSAPQQIIDRLRPKLARIPGAATFLQPVQDIRIGGRQSNAQYQYTLAGRDHRGPAEVRSAAAGAAAPRAGISGRQHRPAEQRAAGAAHLRPPHAGAPRPDAAGARQHAVQRLRPGRSLHHLYATESILRGDGGGSQVLAIARGAEGHLPDPNDRRRRHPARHGGPLRSLHVAAGGESHRAVSVGDGLVQSGAGRLAGTGDH